MAQRSEDLVEILRVPSGEFSWAFDGLLSLTARTRLDGSDEVDGEVAGDGHIFGAMALSQAGLIVFEDDVEHPMEFVLDGPMAARRFGRPWRCQRRR